MALISYLRSWALIGALLLAIICVSGGLLALRRPSMADWPRLETQSGDGFGVWFYGTSSLAFVDRDGAFVLDGFVSRPSIGRIIFSRIRADDTLVRRTFSSSGVGSVYAVLTAHSHYDHAMDAAAVVRQFGGEVWGTASTAKIASAEGVAHRLVSAGDVLQAGGFTVRVFGNGHSPGGIAMDDIGDDFQVPAKVKDYRYGGGLGLHLTRDRCRIMVIPSSGMPDRDLAAYPADVIFLSIAQLGRQDADYVRRYYDATVKASGAKLLVPIHWDDFTRPLAKPLVPLPYMVERTDKAMRYIMAIKDDDVQVRLPVVGSALQLPAPCNG